MNRHSIARIAGCSVAALTPAALAQFAMVVDSGADRIILLDALDGSVVNANWIDVGSATGGLSGTIQEAIQVGNEVWLTDQTADRIWRFNAGGGLIGEIGVGSLNDIRGFEVVGNTAYVTQGTAGNDGTPQGIITIDITTGMITGSFAGRPPGDFSYFDVLAVGRELWVTNIDTGNDAIERFDPAGNFLGIFAASDGVASFDFLQQLALADGGQTLLGGGFSAPSGVFAFDIDSGDPLGIVAGNGFGPRGVFELGNGQILWGNGSFLAAGIDPTSGTVILDGGSFRYINATSLPTPGASGVVILAGLALARRRRDNEPRP